MSIELCGVIFDLDGTLVDSRLDFPAMRRETGCPEGTGLLEYLAELPDANAREQAAAIIHRHEMEGAAAATWMPGARETLAALHSNQVPLGVVTRNSREAATVALSRLGAPAMDLLAREDARPKPDPDGLLQLSEQWQLAPAKLVYVGDFRFDLEAAARAGMHSALYLQADNRAYAEQAGYSFEHFAQLQAWLLDRLRLHRT